MKRTLLMSLLALGALAGAIEQVHAAGHCYYPYGWYIPKGSCWVRWHGYRELWVPPSTTHWTVTHPLCQPPDGCLPPGGPQIPLQPLGFLPPPPCADGGWFHGKQCGYQPTIRQLIPTPPPGGCLP